MSTVNKGRPLLYKTPEELRGAIEGYFESCWQEKWEYDKRAKKWTQCLDHEGNPIKVQHKPYTMTGLALALNTSRLTLKNYRERADFEEIVQWARDMCENYLEEGMLKNKIPAIPAIFNAKNNYGWADKSELDVNTNITEMPTVKKDGEDVKFDVGTPDTTESS
jgi:hypothetical protein